MYVTYIYLNLDFELFGRFYIVEAYDRNYFIFLPMIHIFDFQMFGAKF